MTPERIAELNALCDAATPGPWFRDTTSDTGKWEFSDPDWNEFFEVIKGNGPCNKERLAVRKWSEEHGRWVRNALKKADARYAMPLA